MNNTSHNGGPAFATGNPEQGGSEGMSLRDWFAGQASEADVDYYQEFDVDFDNPGFGAVAKYSREQAKYRYADAMLKAREDT